MARRAQAKTENTRGAGGYPVEAWPIDRIKPYAGNARTHPGKQIEQLRGSIRRFGQVFPLLVREDGTLISGHGRLEALKLEKVAEVEVVIAAGWTEAQCRAFGIADNQIAANSKWDDDALRRELNALAGALELGEVGQLGDLGFSDKELQKLISDAESAPAAGKCKGPGDLKPVIQFNIVFDDEAQQESWFSFVRMLKKRFPDAQTLGARLSLFLAEPIAG